MNHRPSDLKIRRRLPGQAFCLAAGVVVALLLLSLSGCKPEQQSTGKPSKPGVASSRLVFTLKRPASARLHRVGNTLHLEIPPWEPGQPDTCLLELTDCRMLHPERWPLYTDLTLELFNGTTNRQHLTAIFEDAEGRRRLVSMGLAPGSGALRLSLIERPGQFDFTHLVRLQLVFRRSRAPLSCTLGSWRLEYHPDRLVQGASRHLKALDELCRKLVALDGLDSGHWSRYEELRARFRALQATLKGQSSLRLEQLRALETLAYHDLPDLHRLLLRQLAGVYAGRPAGEGGYFVSEGLVRVNPEYGTWEGPFDPEARFTCARGEVGLRQVVLVSGASPLRRVTWRLQPLRDAKGHSFPLEELQIRPLGYVFCKTPRFYSTEGEGWYADVELLDLKALNVPAQRFRALLVRVKVPLDQPAGEYTGALSLDFEGAEVQIPLHLEVLDYALPRTFPCEIWAPASPEYTRKLYRRKWQERQAQLEALLLDYGVLPFDWSEGPPTVAQVEEAMRRGHKFFPAGDFAPGDSRDSASQAVVSLVENWRRLSSELPPALAKRGLACSINEPSCERLPDLQAAVEKLHLLAPELRCAVSFTPETLCSAQALANQVDTWVIPLDALFDFSGRKNNPRKQCWIYLPETLPPPAPNLFIESDLAQIRALAGALAIRFDISGLCYPAANAWPESLVPFRQNVLLGLVPSTAGGANGAGWLVYPTTTGLVPSLRLEALLQGLQDYKLCLMLRKASVDSRPFDSRPGLEEARKVAGVPRGMVASLAQIERHPAAYSEWHRRQALALAQLKRNNLLNQSIGEVYGNE